MFPSCTQAHECPWEVKNALCFFGETRQQAIYEKEKMHFKVIWKHLATRQWPLLLSPVPACAGPAVLWLLEAVQLLQVPGVVWLKGWMLQLAAPHRQPPLPIAPQPGWLSLWLGHLPCRRALLSSPTVTCFHTTYFCLDELRISISFI